jgi:purine-nucleoside phosphorylase
MIDLPARIEAARARLASLGGPAPEIGIILGTGLGPLASRLEIDAELDYADIPHFPAATVDGHAGKWVAGRLAGRAVAVMQGRFHYYEGHSLQDLAFPVRVMKALGARSLVITNIAGGVNPGFALGDIMALTDHINLLGSNPLVGPNHESIGPRFPDMSEPYNRELLRKLAPVAASRGIALRTGVYACMSGPCLETAAEYRMLRILGADAVGMSTVPEVIAAVHAGLKVAALSLISDVCDPDNLMPIDIPALMRVVSEAEPRMAALVEALVREM